MEISKADIVIALAGRDQGKYFFVIECDGQYVTIADGKSRRLEHPKRKKLKHVRKVFRADSHVARKLLSGDRVLNSELRRELAEFGQQCNSQNQGG